MTDTSNQQLQKISRSKAAAIALLLLVSTSFGFVGGWVGSRTGNEQLQGNSTQGQQILTSEGELISDIAEEVGQSVVSISVTSEESRRDIFGFQDMVEQESAGTGFILS